MTTETKHTPEPWVVGQTPTIGINRVYSEAYGVGGHICGDALPANASRIVACVNACAGIPQDGLDELITQGGVRELMELAASCAKQRDALAAALRAIAPSDSKQVQPEHE